MSTNHMQHCKIRYHLMRITFCFKYSTETKALHIFFWGGGGGRESTKQVPEALVPGGSNQAMLPSKTFDFESQFAFLAI